MDKPEIFKFIEMTTSQVPEGLEERANQAYIDEKIAKNRNFRNMKIIDVQLFDSGEYSDDGKVTIDGLPDFYRVRINANIGDGRVSHIKVFLPKIWNERLITNTGGLTASEFPTNYYESINPMKFNAITIERALMNHFAVVSADNSVDINGKWGFRENTDELDWNQILYWAYRGTHEMTVIAKEIIKIVYQKPASYAYLQGTSAGGRQTMVMAQLYPKDFDAVVAGYQAAPWIPLLISEAWGYIVLNNENYKLPPAKLKAVRDATLEKYHSLEKGYVDNDYFPIIDMMSLVGLETDAGPITKRDAEVLKKIFDGPTFSNGQKMPKAYSFSPVAWIAEDGSGLQLILDEDGTAHTDTLLAPRQVFSWVMKEPDLKLEDITYEDLDWIYNNGAGEFRFADGQNIDMTEFKNNGGKIIYHAASGDGNVPARSNYEYAKRLAKYYGNELDDFFKFYFTYGGNHTGFYDGVYGEQISMTDSLKAVMQWREDGIEPNKLKTLVWNENKQEIAFGRDAKAFNFD